MGLQGQLNDVSDSIPLLFIAIIATFIGHLRSLLSTLLHPARRLPQSDAADGGELYPSGFSTLIALAEQLNLNRALSHRFDPAHAAADCVVCLSSLRDGEQVRRLPCRHVFHKGCFDGWLDQLNFSCPLCRSPLVSDARASAGRRVGRDFVAWFALR